MKKTLIILCCIVLAIISIIVVYRAINYVDTSFTTKVTLKYHYGDKKIDVVLTDKNDIKIIKDNIGGVSYGEWLSGERSCGFDENISITLSGKWKSIVFYPACDTCGGAKLANTNRYVDGKNWDAIRKVLEKYGFTFPCV